MLAGHMGAALAIGRADRRTNVGLYIAAALLLDVVLWVLVLLGAESVTLPANFAETHQPQFFFPYSHGLAASLAWAALSGSAALMLFRTKGRTAALLAAAVFSHWLLDALVHRPELPLLGIGSPQVGLGWWQHMPLALAAEAAITVVGLGLFVVGSRLPRGRLHGLAALSLAILVFTVMGMTLAPPPPSVSAMAGMSLMTLLLATALAYWLGRLPRR